MYKSSLLLLASIVLALGIVAGVAAVAPQAAGAATTVTPVVTLPTGTGTYTIGSTIKVSWTTNVAVSKGEFIVRAGNATAGYFINPLVKVVAGTRRYNIDLVLTGIPLGSNYAIVIGYRAVARTGNFTGYGTSPGRFSVTAATPTPTPTPTPTVTPTPSVPAGYTLVQKQTINNLATNGLTNKYYYQCTFTGGTSTTAVLSFTGTTSNIIFDGCTIASGGGWNGVTINDANGTIHDITFKNCLFKSQGRMGFECTSRPTTAVTQYQHIDITGSTFEPQGNEAVSYDGGAAAGNCLFSGNTIQGAGNDPAQPYAHGLEVNGPTNMTVTGNRIYQCRGAAFNLQMHVTTPCGWVVTDNICDMSQRIQSTPMGSAAQVVVAFNVYGGTFARNTIVSASPGGSVAYLSNCHGMDWRTSTWTDASNRAYYDRPTLKDGSADNLF